jgi:hypothetical protein
MRMKLVIDSGAFSAWRLNRIVDLDAYCTFLEQNRDWIEEYIALDVIVPHDTEAAAEQSFANLVKMRERGLKPWGVLHAGEDISWLHRMLDIGCDYVCLAGSSLASRDHVTRWYEYCWSHLVTADGLPIAKVHALGEARLPILLRYPWASADSSSWLYGPQLQATVTVIDKRRLSARRDGRGDIAKPDINMLLHDDADALQAALDEIGIKDAKQLIDGPQGLALRSFIEVRRFVRYAKQVNAAQPIRFHPSGLFSQGNVSARPPITFNEFAMYFVMNSAGGSNRYGVPAFVKTKSPYILSSYFYMQTPKQVQAIKDLVLDVEHTLMTLPKYQKALSYLEGLSC